MVRLFRIFSFPSSTLTYSTVLTGEEEEETLHQVRGKLFSLDDSQWKERGTGLLKLNVRQVDGTNARLGMFHLAQSFFPRLSIDLLVMRKDAVYTLLLNITLFPGMRCSLSQDPRYLRFSAIENGVTTTYNLKVRVFPCFLKNSALTTSFARCLTRKLHPIFWKKSMPISLHEAPIPWY